MVTVTNFGSVEGVVIEDTVVPARGSWSRALAKGEMLRIVDLEGKQAVDFLCYNAHDHADRYAAADTMKINPAGIFLSAGTVLYSVGLTPLFTIVADTCGKHDTIGGCCNLGQVRAFADATVQVLQDWSVSDPVPSDER